MPPNFRDVSSLGCLCQHSNGRWRVRANLDGRSRYGPYRATEAEAADDMAKARRSGTRTGYITILEELATACASIRGSAPVRRRPAQRGAASSSVPQPAASVRSRSRSRSGSAARQDNASVAAGASKQQAAAGASKQEAAAGASKQQAAAGASTQEAAAGASKQQAAPGGKPAASIIDVEPVTQRNLHA